MQPISRALLERMLSRLLGEGYGHALLGDLAEERERRLRSGSPREAARWYRNHLYRSLAAVLLRLRAVELASVTPWGIAMAAYVLVGVLEFGVRLFLSWAWPEEAHAASTLRLVLEFPGIACMSYIASRFHRRASFVLGGLMLVVAALMSTIGSETLSRAYVVAFLTVGPLAALLGGLLHRGRERMAL